ncbi:uncharacterized protein BDZ83DRAFT_643757 [Colletotrichum acutatum]|uniref:Uncharacterized protein n=1 Tax=Glomerella acutata TaxID=27357 RepID=A0AAD8UBL2_GLOAC|nr:uncharacterized protein BDZ83DRAFT_643757 [Colletotrichum acutatum]KAK1706137.1 hypothetical protein BDZ83DRAFT_643757 [Colletotrichum acutatum]
MASAMELFLVVSVFDGLEAWEVRFGKIGSLICDPVILTNGDRTECPLPGIYVQYPRYLPLIDRLLARLYLKHRYSSRIVGLFRSLPEFVFYHVGAS